MNRKLPFLPLQLQTTRRTFLKKTGTGLAGTLAASCAPSLLAATRASSEEKLGLAIVGLGGYASGSIAPELHTCKHVRLAGVVTGDPEKKGKEWAQKYGFAEDAIYTYDTFDKIASDDRIDYVHIALPNSMHAEYAIRAAKAGKHVLVEKPMAVSSEECRAMITAAKDAGVLLGVNYRLHWEPHHVRATELLAEGAVGHLTNGTYEFSWGYYGALTGPNAAGVKKWLLDPEITGGGALFDTGVYPVQAACYLTGREPVAVRGLPARRHPDIFPKGVEETMGYELLFEDGFQAICRASYSQSFQQCTTIGPKGTVEILPGKRGSAFGQSGGGKSNEKLLFANGEEIVLDQILQQATLEDAFASAIKAGDSTFKTPGEMGLRDIRILEAIYESVEKGGIQVML